MLDGVARKVSSFLHVLNYLLLRYFHSCVRDVSVILLFITASPTIRAVLGDWLGHICCRIWFDKFQVSQRYGQLSRISCESKMKCSAMPACNNRLSALKSSVYCLKWFSYATSRAGTYIVVLITLLLHA